jgi:hypothetical protein
MSVDVLSAEFRMHMKLDDERNDNILHSLKNINTKLDAISTKFDSSIARVHTQIEEKSDEAIEQANAAFVHAQAAHDKIPGVKLWVLGGLITGLLTAGGLLIKLVMH